MICPLLLPTCPIAIRQWRDKLSPEAVELAQTVMQASVTWKIKVLSADVFMTVCHMGSKLLSPWSNLRGKKIKNPALVENVIIFFFIRT